MIATRQLAAIMFTDMEGYTALMQRNEQAAIARRRRHREVFEQTMTNHGGKIIQYYGDGTLSIFSSAIHAVNAGLEMQLHFIKEPKVPLRIGIHIGDISIDDSGVYGDGVNVASRIESSAVAGSIFISDKVFDEIKNQPDVETMSMGIFELKNVLRPVEIFAVVNEGIIVPDKAAVKVKSNDPANRLAVLPFVNMSNDQENEYFSDGITEELINSLARIPELQLTCRTSSFSFKGKSQDVREIGRILNVGKVLAGSVRKSGNRVRINTELVNTADGYQLWSETFDRNLNDIFELQDEIAAIIGNRMREQFLGKGIQEVVSPNNVESYELYLKGLFYYNKGTPTDYYKSIQFFEKALTIDTYCANAHAMLASAYAALAATGNVNSASIVEKVRIISLNAIRLNSRLPQAYLSMAMMQLYFEFEFEEALKNINRALLISPNSSEAHHVASQYYSIVNNKERMVNEAEIALRSDPLSLTKNNQLGEALLYAERLNEAEKQLLKTSEMDPSWRTPLEKLAFVYQAKGELEKSLEYWDKIRKAVNQPGKGVSGYAIALGLLGRHEEAQFYIDQLHQRTNDELNIDLDSEFANAYAAKGEMDKAFYYLDSCLQKKAGSIMFCLRYPLNQLFMGDKRFWEILEKMGLSRFYKDSTFSD